jgi:hypothetical protein
VVAPPRNENASDPDPPPAHNRALLDELVVRRVRVAPEQVVFLKGVIDASEGLAAVFAEHGGDLTIATMPSQKEELDRILKDLREETGALLDFT